MISEEVRVKKLRGEASRAILEDTLRFFFFFSIFFFLEPLLF